LNQQWCLPAVADAAFVAQMEEVLDVYERPPDPTQPLVCVDESYKELQQEIRAPQPLQPGQPARYDHEYAPQGLGHLFMLCAPHANWRHVEVTEARGGQEFALCMRDLVDVHFPRADRIVVVVDNLNTHSKASLYAHFPPAEAHRIAQKLEFHYTPKHGSWLNMAEIELSVVGQQCLAQRIPDRAALAREVRAWEERRNAAHGTIRWQFRTKDARMKLERLYPCIEHDI
jgi:hypothetical protein